MIHEGLVPLVGEVRLDDGLEERGVLAGEEEVEFMAGVLRVAFAALIRRQFRPCQEP